MHITGHNGPNQDSREGTIRRPSRRESEPVPVAARIQWFKDEQIDDRVFM